MFIIDGNKLKLFKQRFNFMELRKLGISEIEVSCVGLGTMTFGEQCSKNLSFEILDFAFENGINFFDTAEMYQFILK